MKTPFFNPPATCQIPNLAGKWEALFGKKRDGVFVEVGAYDGESFSNTSFLADVGWTGLYIEPIAEYAQKCRERHARNENVRVAEVAISNKPGQQQIHLGGTLTTLSGEQVADYDEIGWAKGIHQGEKRFIDVQTLDATLRNNEISTGFDLLVIDVEGFEREVLEGFAVEEFMPTVIVAELEDDHADFRNNERVTEAARYIRGRLARAGYVEYYRDVINTIFVLASKYQNLPKEIRYFEPLLTVGIPTRNGAKTIERALASVAAQTYRSFTVAISDNNSTDDTSNFIQTYLTRFPDAKMIRQRETLAAYDNFKAASVGCKTKYFVYLADDDFWEPDYLERCVSALEADESLTSAFTQYRVYYHYAERYDHIIMHSDSASDDKVERVLVRARDMAPCAFYGVHRTEPFIKAIQQVGIFDFSDVAITIRLAVEGKLKNLPFDLYRSGVSDEARLTRNSLDGGRIKYLPFAFYLIRFSLANFPLPQALRLIPKLLSALRVVERSHKAARAKPSAPPDYASLPTREQIEQHRLNA
ncbi:methyltransferase, FkbM family [Methylobacterium sp. 275MFSha3.1]|uniref:FkbM family methyltransferase n=1 Tax=Methylobacterium sp. 275MFSha3.1 TaxID=1502746 RepID=UPI0008A73FF5|nr:FkbM family methyltransferase [Methylobacterium sp. 275MFSha3.1]SEI12391.1 methyltransferase, FkbM family [Methylobacterium sp. 275MFSha3.1]